MTLGLFFSIASFTILLVLMYFLIKIYLAQPATSATTCSGSKPFSLVDAERENQERVIREQRELEAGILWNNAGAERRGPVEHDERPCPGMHHGDSGGTLYGEDCAN